MHRRPLVPQICEVPGFREVPSTSVGTKSLCAVDWTWGIVTAFPAAILAAR
jgi:hypothetical protein